MRVTISSFGGITPRLSAHSLSSISASIAHDVKLRNGRLEAWRERCEYAQVGATDLTFYIYGCCPLSWNTIVYATEVSPEWGRLYLTGRAAQPEFLTVDCHCEPTYQLLGVPAPTTPPVISGQENCSRASDARAYVYTYVNQYGEESAPSPVSNILTVEDGEPVLVRNIALPPDGYGITHARIYRATSGFRNADGKQQRQTTAFLYVDTIEFPTTTYTDTVLMLYVTEALETEKVRMPPNGLTNLTSIEGVVRLAGTTKNTVHMTEQFQLHNWPVKYDLTLDSTIVHMGCLDQKLFVTTDTTPYVIDVSSCEDVKCTPVLDVGIHLPDISCGYASSFVMTQHGMIYSSPIGLILIDPSAKHYILTAKWFSEDDWQQLQPDTVRLAYWEGFLFCITDSVSFMLNIDGVPYADMTGAELVTISDKPVDIRTNSVGKLFMLESGAITIWNTGTELREFLWVSRELTGGQHEPSGQIPSAEAPLGCAWSPSSAKIRTKDTEFTLIVPPDDVFTRKVVSEKPFRLPRVGRHMFYKVRLRGKYPVEFLTMGTAYFTVNQGA